MQSQSKPIPAHEGQQLQMQYDTLLNLYNVTHKKLSHMLYLPQILAQREEDARKHLETAKNFEQQYHELHRIYANLARTASKISSCPICKTNKRTPNVKDTEENPLYTSRSAAVSRSISYQSIASPKITGKPSRTDSWQDFSKLQTDGGSSTAAMKLTSLADKYESDHVSPVAATTSKTPVRTKETNPSMMFDLPEVSKKNFDRLATEYTRMKHAVTKIERDGVDMTKYLTFEEYEMIIRGLREDLTYARLQLDELRYINQQTAGGNLNQLDNKCRDLLRQVGLLGKTVRMKDERIEELVSIIKAKPLDTAPMDTVSTQIKENVSSKVSSGSEKIEKIIAELAEARSQLTNKDQFIKECERQKLVDDKHILEVQLDLDKVKDENISFRNSYTELLSSYEKLSSQPPVMPVECPESVRDLLREKKSLQEKVDLLYRDLKGTLEEKQVLILQCQTFNEDYERLKHDYGKLEKSQKKSDVCTISQHKQLENKVSQLHEQLSTYQAAPRSASLGYSSQGSSPSIRSHGADSGYATYPYSSSISEISSQSSSTTDSGFGSGSGSGSGSAMKPKEFICRRCETTFKLFEKDKFEEHKRKCLLE